LGVWGDTDYGWACFDHEPDYVHLLPGALDDALIISDLPSPLAWHPLAEHTGILVKWVGADSDEQASAHLTKLDCEDFDAPAVHFSVADELVVFDSASTLAEVDDNHLSFHLKPGRYAVASKTYSGPDIELQLMKFERVD